MSTPPKGSNLTFSIARMPPVIRLPSSVTILSTTPLRERRQNASRA